MVWLSSMQVPGMVAAWLVAFGLLATVAGAAPAAAAGRQSMPVAGLASTGPCASEPVPARRARCEARELAAHEARRQGEQIGSAGRSRLESRWREAVDASRHPHPAMSRRALALLGGSAWLVLLARRRRRRMRTVR